MSEASDREEVLAVIDLEQRAFWSKDWAGFERCYLHAPFTQRWGATKFGGMYRRQGWQDLGDRARNLMQVTPAATMAFADNAVRNIEIRVSGDMAWATYERHYEPVPGLGANWPNGQLHGLRILERHDGAWKIVLAGSLDPGFGDGSLVQVASDGRVLWKSQAATAYLATSDDFLVRAGRLRLRDRRMDGRLQEAIGWAAGVDWNMVGMRDARPVLLDRVAGPMRVCWVAVDAGAILVVLEDTRPAAERLDYAARFFRLSPAQVELAAAIIEDRPLADFAAAYGITLNTARTHKRRLFEKVGVRSQPALVRVLLSLSAPR